MPNRSNIDKYISKSHNKTGWWIFLFCIIALIVFLFLKPKVLNHVTSHLNEQFSQPTDKAKSDLLAAAWQACEEVEDELSKPYPEKKKEIVKKQEQPEKPKPKEPVEKPKPVKQDPALLAWQKLNVQIDILTGSNSFDEALGLISQFRSGKHGKKYAKKIAVIEEKVKKAYSAHVENEIKPIKDEVEKLIKEEEFEEARVEVKLLSMHKLKAARAMTNELLARIDKAQKDYISALPKRGQNYGAFFLKARPLFKNRDYNGVIRKRVGKTWKK